MANPPTLTPEQRQRALEKAAAARRQRAEVKDKLKIGSLSLARAVRGGRRGDDERHAREAEGRERARVAARRRQGRRQATHGGARHLREPPAARARDATRARARLLERSSPRRAGRSGRVGRRERRSRGERGVLLVLAGTSGAGKGTIGRRLLRAGARTLRWSVSWTTRAAAPGRGRRASTTTSSPARSSSASATRAASSSGSRSTATSRARPGQFVDDALAAGHDVLLEIDVQGALAVREAHPRGAPRVRAGARPGRSSARRLEAAGDRRARGDRAPAGPGRGRGARSPERFDAVVVNDDVDRAVGRARCYPGGSPAAGNVSPRGQLPRHLHLDGDPPPSHPGSTPMAERRASLMEPRIEQLHATGRLQVHAGDARRRCGPARSTTTTTSSARASAGSCRRRSRRCRASRCRSRWKRSRPTRSCTSASSPTPTTEPADDVAVEIAAADAAGDTPA